MDSIDPAGCLPAGPVAVADAAGVDVDAFLTEHGVSEGEILEARGTGTLALLVMDVFMFPSRQRYSEQQLVQQVGADPAYAKNLWRAMGFPNVSDGEPSFTDDDLHALAQANSREGPVHDHFADEDHDQAIVRQTRVLSASLARIAEQSVDDFEHSVEALRRQGASDEDVAKHLIATMDLGRFEWMIWYMFRRQWRAAMWRRLASPRDGGELAVGFVDLVRFSAVTEQVADEELEQLVVRFDEVARDAIADGGGRVVKMIGDAVMFAADDPIAAADIALDLVDAYASDPLLPPARAGLATGPVLARDGDYYGPVVNLAARIVDIARVSRVVVSDPMHEALARSPRFRFHRLPPKRLKGIGRVTLWAVDAVDPTRRVIEPRVGRTSSSTPS